MWVLYIIRGIGFFKEFKYIEIDKLKLYYIIFLLEDLEDSLVFCSFFGL